MTNQSAARRWIRLAWMNDMQVLVMWVRKTENLLERAFVARGLAPAGLRSSPRNAQGRFAPQWGQAPSPQRFAPRSGFGSGSTLADGKRHCLTPIKNAPYRLIRGISVLACCPLVADGQVDRKSTRLNSS